MDDIADLLSIHPHATFFIIFSEFGQCDLQGLVSVDEISASRLCRFPCCRSLRSQPGGWCGIICRLLCWSAPGGLVLTLLLESPLVGWCVCAVFDEVRVGRVLGYMEECRLDVAMPCLSVAWQVEFWKLRCVKYATAFLLVSCDVREWRIEARL